MRGWAGDTWGNYGATCQADEHVLEVRLAGGDVLDHEALLLHQAEHLAGGDRVLVVSDLDRRDRPSSRTS